MVDKLGLLQQALSALRTQATQRAAPTRTPDQRQPFSVQQSPTHGLPTLNRRLRQRIASIDAEDPQRRKRALRALVEVSLLQEFGDTLDADPAFNVLVDQVVHTMEHDEQLCATLEQALKDLPP